MHLLLNIYVGGVAITFLFIIIALVVMTLEDKDLKLQWKDLWLSILSIIGWPIFWILLIASKISYPNGIHSS